MYSYNKNGQLLTRTDALGGITTYAYDAEGRQTAQTDALGHTTTYRYDALGRLIEPTDATGVKLSSVYDAAGNLLQTIDTEGNVILQATYDPMHNKLTETDALHRTSRMAYNELNRVTGITDPLGRTTTRQYDRLGRLVTVTDPLAGVSRQTFDAAGLVAHVTNPNGDELAYTYDQAGRVLTESNAAGGTLRYGYDPRGLMTQRTNARGQTSKSTYDDGGHLTARADAEGTIRFEYDANGNPTSIGENGQTITRTYDALNRVVSYTDARGNTVSYTYDAAGNRTKLTYPDGRSVQYTYDAANRMTGVTDWAGRTTRYTYDTNGRLHTTTRPDGSVETRTYDAAGQLLLIQDVAADGTVLVEDGYSYDEAGNVTQEKSSSYSYDANNRLTEANGMSYAYDAAGNLTSIGSDYIMTYTKDNRLATVNGQPVTYDADGNLTAGPLDGKLQQHLYDVRNRLIQAGDTRYKYDAENHRISMTTDAGTTYYVTDPEAYFSQLLMETDEDGKAQAAYLYGLGLIGREDASGRYSVYHYDRRCSTVALTNETGAITDRYTYGVYGEVLSREGDTANPFLYNGRDGVMTDPNGLYYMRARYYNPEIKRFMNRDVVAGSVAEGQTLNRYAYVNGNPISFVDPFGLSREESTFSLGDAGNIAKYFTIGAAKAAWGTAKALFEQSPLVQSYLWLTNPVGQFEKNQAMVHAILHPIDTTNAIGQNIGDAIYYDVINGDLESRSRFAGGATFEIASLFTGGGEAKAATQLTTVAEKSAIEGVEKAATSRYTSKLNQQLFGGTKGPRQSGGQRLSAYNELNQHDIDFVKQEFSEIGGDINKLRFNQGSGTSYVDSKNIIQVRGDVFPLENVAHPRSQMSVRAVLAHEEYGHAAYRGTRLDPGSWNDEFRASYMAAKNTPNLSEIDRYHLIQDAISRAQEAGVPIKNYNFMRSILYGY
ncbi:RHS repeat-associated core domain-containing protein [Gorillibacterium sp. sgz5001074]|uniref:RHS repeat-associated core domain-containing protein n=1 Tax=Gorillibacterium sp. sgz5001074 TaxID=3446695 RepID=UPI003F667FEE